MMNSDLNTSALGRNFPPTQYLGSKQKLINWVLENIPDGKTVFDAFSGSGIVSYNLKKNGRRVISNDILHSSYLFAKSLVENDSTALSQGEIDRLFQENANKSDYIERNFAEVFFTRDETVFLDNLHANIEEIGDPYKKSIAYSAAVRTCIQKMPGGKFRANLLKYRDESFKHYRLKYVKDIRKTYLEFLKSFNNSVFSNGLHNEAHNMDVFDLLPKINADVAYYDPPYAGTGFDYGRDYFFVELFTKDYGKIDTFKGITKSYDVGYSNNFIKSNIEKSITKLLQMSSHIPVLVFSYNNRSIPDMKSFVEILRSFRTDIKVHEKVYHYKTGDNNGLKELIFVCK
ncbi:MAG: DNA adenine methylase [Thermoplasmatales archaeon]